MGELVGEQRVADERAGSILRRAEADVVSDGECTSVHLVGESTGGIVGVHLDPVEGPSEGRLHPSAHVPGERPAAAEPGDHVRRRGRRPLGATAALERDPEPGERRAEVEVAEPGLGDTLGALGGVAELARGAVRRREQGGGPAAQRGQRCLEAIPARRDHRPELRPQPARRRGQSSEQPGDALDRRPERGDHRPDPRDDVADEGDGRVDDPLDGRSHPLEDRSHLLSEPLQQVAALAAQRADEVADGVPHAGDDLARPAEHRRRQAREQAAQTADARLALPVEAACIAVDPVTAAGDGGVGLGLHVLEAGVGVGLHRLAVGVELGLRLCRRGPGVGEGRSAVGDERRLARTALGFGAGSFSVETGEPCRRPRDEFADRRIHLAGQHGVGAIDGLARDAVAAR